MRIELESRYEALLKEILYSQSACPLDIYLDEATAIGKALGLETETTPEEIAAILLTASDKVVSAHLDLAFSFITAKINPAHIALVKGHGAAYRDVVSQDMAAYEQSAETRRLQIELTHERNRYQLATRHSMSGSWEWDIEEDHSIWDDRMFHIYEISRDEFKDGFKGWVSYVHPDDQARVTAAVGAALQGEGPFSTPFRYTLTDGKIKHIRTEGTVIHNAIGKPVRIIGINTDITHEVELQERLLEQKERLEMAQTMGGFGIWDWDLSTNGVYWDEVTYGFFGLDPCTHQSINKIEALRQIVHPDDVARIEVEIKQALEKLRVCPLDFRIVANDGSVRRFNSQGAIARDERGQPMRIFGLIHDVTEDHQVLEQMRLSQMVLAQTNDVILITEAGLLDAPGPRIIFANNALEKVTGYQPQEIIGSTPRILQGQGTDRETLDRIRSALQNWQPIEVEVLNYKKNGESFWSELSITPVADEKGWFTHWISVQRDVSQRKANELELRRATEAKTRFLANMSHEIRNPLNSVVLLSKLLESDRLDESKRKQCVSRITAATKSVTAILDEILDFSKIETGQTVLEPAPFELAEILAEVRGTFESTAQAKGLTLDIHNVNFDTQLLGDRQRLKQVLINLVGNAVKFTNQGRITLEVIAEQREGDIFELAFVVTDSGIGISSDAIPKLFDPFTQAYSGITRQFGGTGLGLSISKNLVALMGGVIEVKSTPGLGSTFQFSIALPFVDPGLQRNPSLPSEVSNAFLGLRVLLVDDDEVNNEAMRGLLEHMGARVNSVVNGLDALELLHGAVTSFDLVIMDIQMPVMDGITATRKIRTELNLKGLPIIALTAGVLPHQQQEAISAGMNELRRSSVSSGNQHNLMDLFSTH